MSETINVPFLLPRAIRRGLSDGTLMRKGGLILRTEDNRVYAWLRETGPVAESSRIVAMLQAQVVGLTSQAAQHRKLDHIIDVTEATQRVVLRIERDVIELRLEQITRLADPILEALDHIEAAATATEAGGLHSAATLGLAQGRTRICRWLQSRTGEQLVADIPLVRYLTHALLLGGCLEIARLDAMGAERVLDKLGGVLTAVDALIRAVRPASRLPSVRELAGMKGRREYLAELEMARLTVSSRELRTLGHQTPVALIDKDGVDRGLLIVVEESEVVHVAR